MRHVVPLRVLQQSDLDSEEVAAFHQAVNEARRRQNGIGLDNDEGQHVAIRQYGSVQAKLCYLFQLPTQSVADLFSDSIMTMSAVHNTTDKMTDDGVRRARCSRGDDCNKRHRVLFLKKVADHCNQFGIKMLPYDIFHEAYEMYKELKEGGVDSTSHGWNLEGGGYPHKPGCRIFALKVVGEHIDGTDEAEDCQYFHRDNTTVRQWVFRTNVFDMDERKLTPEELRSFVGQFSDKVAKK